MKGFGAAAGTAPGGALAALPAPADAKVLRAGPEAAR